MAHVRGTLELRRVARLLRDAPPYLRKEMRENIKKPVKPFEQRVKSETPGSVPGRYAAVLAPAIKVNISSALSGSGLGYTLIVFARGKAEDRDLKAVNAGLLRHPLFGRRSHWYGQQVRGGMVDRAVDDLGRQVAQEVGKAVDEMAAKIVGG